MELKGRTILVLGGAGLVGQAVCRLLLEETPAHLIIAARQRARAERAAESLQRDASAATRLSACWGNIFVRLEYKDLTWNEILDDPEKRRNVLSDVLDPMVGERKREILEHSTLARLLAEYRPHAIVDCINTATAFAYQDVYESTRELLKSLEGDPEALRVAVERHVTKMYTPQLVRHMQILHDSVTPQPDQDRPGVLAYVKVGTSGTGGMGLNIPYTHGEEKPSSVLLSKAAVAGAHSLLMFLLARTPPDRPAVKEVKPSAAIAWAKIARGPISRHGHRVPLYDCPPDRAYPLSEAIAPTGDFGVALRGRFLENVYIDTGENGLYALAEFSALTNLNQMEFVTAEEVARNVVRELKGGNTGYEVISALDQAVLGPSYRAAAMRQGALARMRQLEKESGMESVAFEALGPPQLSKLLFEAHLLKRVSGDSMARTRDMDPETLCRACFDEIVRDGDLRAQIISIGLGILTPSGDRLLRGPVLKASVVEDGWVDPRPPNMRLWQERLTRLRDICHAELEADAGVDSSRFDRVFVDPATGEMRDSFELGDIAAWIFNYEDGGFRMKR